MNRPLKAATLSAGLVAVAVAAPSQAVTLVFTGNTSGSFNTAANFSPAQEPTLADTVITNSSTSTPNVFLTANASAKNLAVNAGSPAGLNFDLNGNTLLLANQSNFNSNITFTDGTVNQQTNGFSVGNGSTFTAGPGSVLGGRGGINLVDVSGNSNLVIDGGTIQQNDGAKRDLFAASGSSVTFTANGGSFGRGGTGAIRNVQLQDGSTLGFTLTNGMFATAATAPINTGGTPNLGTLDIDLAPSYSFVAGEEFFLIDYGFNPSPDTFTNAPTDESQVVFDGVTFQIDYDALNGSISATAVAGPVIPEPASLALVGLGGLLMLGRGRRA